MSRYFSCALNVKDRRVVVLGAGREADSKAARLASAGARVEKVPNAHEPVNLDGAFLVVLCVMNDPALTERVAAKCREKSILLCAIDQPEFCDVVNVAVFEAGELSIGIGTGGVAPAVARKIREGLERSVPVQSVAKFMAVLKKAREQSHKMTDADERRKFLISLAEGFDFKASVRVPTMRPKKGKKKNAKR